MIKIRLPRDRRNKRDQFRSRVQRLTTYWPLHPKPVAKALEAFAHRFEPRSGMYGHTPWEMADHDLDHEFWAAYTEAAKHFSSSTSTVARALCLGYYVGVLQGAFHYTTIRGLDRAAQASSE